MVVEVGESSGDNGFRHGFTAVAAHWLALTVNDDSKMGIGWNR